VKLVPIFLLFHIRRCSYDSSKNSKKQQVGTHFPHTPPSKTHAKGQSAHASRIMYVIKRDGREEPVHFDKITARINKLAYGLNQDFCDPVRALRCPERESANTRETSFFLNRVSRGS